MTDLERELLAALQSILSRAEIDSDDGALALDALSWIRGIARAAVASREDRGTP